MMMVLVLLLLLVVVVVKVPWNLYLKEAREGR
jgi:Tfp pilus assembly protein PilO